jgi:hypothetical protein
LTTLVGVDLVCELWILTLNLDMLVESEGRYTEGSTKACLSLSNPKIPRCVLPVVGDSLEGDLEIRQDQAGFAVHDSED